MAAARGGNTACAKLLIDAKADLEARDSNNTTALIIGVSTGQAELAKLLIDVKADIKGQDDDGTGTGRTALMFRAYYDHTVCTQLLLDAKADPETKIMTVIPL